MGKTLKRQRQRLKNEQQAPPPKRSKAASSGRGLTAAITAALQQRRWQDALAGLEACRAGGKAPKLGAVMRWVRLADQTGAGEEALAARLLDAIMRAAATSDAPPPPTAAGDAAAPAVTAASAAAAAATTGGIVRHSPWAAVPLGHSAECAPGPDCSPADYAGRFHEVCAQGEDAHGGPHAIYAFPEGAVRFEPGRRPPTRVDVPCVPGACVLVGALSRRECAQILAASQALGYTHDVDYTFAGDGGGAAAAAVAGTSAARGQAAAAVRLAVGGPAAGCVWYADPSLLGPLFERCAPLLPPRLGGGDLAGLNARWRLYRYSPGAVYRPHVDGAWPGSGLDATGRYVFDAYADRWSRLTFLVYLNEGFEGGATTFFTPSATPGVLSAHAVAPRAGCVLVFPHGDTAGSLVHEGSAVVRGAKYVLRTDVLYTLPPQDRQGRPREGGRRRPQQQQQQPQGAAGRDE